MRRCTLFWLLLGLGSQLQVLFSLSLSEVAVLVIAPFMMFSEIPHMKRTGAFYFFGLAGLLVLSCMSSLIYNHCAAFQVVRGLSVTCLIFLSIPIVHRLLRNDPEGVKWMFVGMTISLILCTFTFQKSVEVMEAGGDSEAITSNTLYWVSRINSIICLPSMTMYLKLPIAYSVGATSFMAFFALFTTASGRSAALSALGAAAIVLVGRKKRRSIRKIGKYFVLYLSIAIVGIFVFKACYKHAAKSGMLGEKAYAKYFAQTKSGEGIVNLIVGGRASSFMGFLAIADSPILGKGYWAQDVDGYNDEFIRRFGDPDDYSELQRNRAYAMAKGVYRDHLIECHSHITSFWLWYGFVGLCFWLYVMYVMFRYIRQDAYVIPQWFFWLAAGMPGMLWAILFSPFHGRIDIALYVCGMLFCRAVRLGRCQLPQKMIAQIEKVELGR